MSRNFELLQQIEKEHEVFRTPTHLVTSNNAHRTQLDLDRLIREESMRLVQRLFLLQGSKAPRVVVFCGVERGVGTSWVCSCTGETLASQMKSSVCLVDANLRSPFLHEHFRTDNLRGLTDAILEPGNIHDFVHQVNGSNLWLLPCGSRASAPDNMLNSERLCAHVSELRTEFEYTLIDAPPVNLYADTSLLGKLADGVVLIVQANSTRREAAKRAMKCLESANIRVFGTVLNKRVFPIPESVYRRV